MKIKNRKGFTITEILAVIVIIAVLGSIAVTGYRRSVEKAKSVRAVSVLNDAVKAERDFILASGRYTSYWNNLVIEQPDIVRGTVYCLQGENTDNQDDCGDDSSYKVKLTVNSNADKSVVMATRMPDNPYGDYKLFKFMGKDPNIYCKAAATSPTDICSILGFSVRNLPETRNIDREENINCETELHGSLSNASNYNCNRITYDDGSFEERAYKSNGDLFDLFTFNSEGQQTGDLWYNDDSIGFVVYEDGVKDRRLWATSPDNMAAEGLSDKYAAHYNENGKRTDTTFFYPNNEILGYHQYENGKRVWVIDYNEDGTLANFQCYDASVCNVKGTCYGSDCNAGPYKDFLVSRDSLIHATYDSYFNPEQVQQICDNSPIDLVMCH
ncbi:MAG: type II secretion system protein [Elusimicrobiaceae bacterium]|nr:type II secretion system protein [Elusimicrobiaceae bacterium]